jgi:preprotein translocase subunit SecG
MSPWGVTPMHLPKATPTTTDRIMSLIVVVFFFAILFALGYAATTKTELRKVQQGALLA